MLAPKVPKMDDQVMVRIPVREAALSTVKVDTSDPDPTPVETPAY